VPRPRHSLKGRQCGEEVDRISLRLAFRKAQAAAGDIVLLLADESEALTHPCPALAWAERGAELRVSAPGQARKVAMMGALGWRDRWLIVATSETRRSADFAAYPEDLDHPYGPKPGRPQNPVVIVQGKGPIHTSKATKAAPAARAHWLSVEWLPKYAPEPNDIETVRRDLNRLLKKDFVPALWRKSFRFRPKKARNPGSMRRFWTDFPVSGACSRRVSTFSAAC